MQWASVLSKKNNIYQAADEARNELLKSLGADPDLLLVFVSPDYHLHYNQLPEIFKSSFPKSLCIGCSALGVIAGGQELEDRTGIAVMGACLPDVLIEPVTLTTDEEQQKFLEHCDGRKDSQLMLLSDPVSFEHERFLEAVNQLKDAPQVIGGLASGSAEIGYNALFVGDQILKGGAVAVLLSGNIVLDQLVFQGARPVGDPMFVTACEGNLVYELDGQSAQSVMFDLLSNVKEGQQHLLQQGLLLGVEVSDTAQLDSSEYTLRNILAVDTDAQCLILDHAVHERAIVRFHLRDPELIQQSLIKHLKDYKRALGKRTPEGALLFTCISKGSAYYQKKSYETRLFKKCFSSLPIGGFFSAGEYGRVKGRSLVQGHSSTFCFFRSARES